MEQMISPLVHLKIIIEYTKLVCMIIVNILYLSLN